MQDFFPNITKNKLENALYVVATPIGNLGDITLRALQTLDEVDFVICEDTRVTAKLFSAYQIKEKKLITYNDHADETIRQKILNLLILGHSIALVSDAGTPLISDPGYKLINFLRQKDQKIIPLPGASSVLSALSASGLACDNFLFIGFLPTTKIQKANLLKSLPKNFTLVFFESANRIVETLDVIEENMGNRKACAAKELTKLHEEIISNDVKNLREFFNKNPNKLKGEFVLIIEKIDKNEKSFSEEDLLKDIAEAIKMGHSLKDLSQNLAEIYDLNKKEIYKMAIGVSKDLEVTK